MRPIRLARACAVGVALTGAIALFACAGRAPQAAAEAGRVSQAAAQAGRYTPFNVAAATTTETVKSETAAYTFEMISLPGGTFVQGSPANEPGRGADEGPQRTVTVSPFSIGKHEVTWDEYEVFRLGRDLPRAARARSAIAAAKPGTPEAVTRPTPPYVDESWGYGKGKQVLIGIPRHSASEYARWLSLRTGKTFRLPTEAEWEYACRAGTTTAYSFGNDARLLDQHAWFEGNSEGKPHLVGQKAPNAFGLHDMHGNVSEWTQDLYKKDAYALLKPPVKDPVVPATEEDLYPHVVRGGSWDDEPPMLRCAARVGSSEDWNRRDPQVPKSIWWLTDATFVGFRLVRVP